MRVASHPHGPEKAQTYPQNLSGERDQVHRRGSITIDAHAHNEGVELSVTDTGIGIPPEAQALIFEPFRQLDSSDTRRYNGSGLGLHIVQRLLTLLRGTVAVESEVGHGSMFRVWVPQG
jgi:signal transduction histidine kinase